MGQVLSVKEYVKKKNKTITGVEVRLAYGIFWYEIIKGVKKVTAKCNFQDRKYYRAYARASAKSFGARMVASKKMRKMARLAAYMLFQNSEVDYEYLGKMFFPKHLIPALSVKTILKKREVMEYIEEQTEKQLAKWGVDDEMVIKRCFIQAMEIAERNKDADILLKIGKELATLKNMYPNKRVVTNQIEMSRNTEYIDNMIDKIDEKLQIAEVIEEVEDDNQA